MPSDDIKKQVIEGLKEVFGESDNPQQMKVLVRRIPIICTNIETMHDNIKEIKDNVHKIDSKLNGEMLKYHAELEQRHASLQKEVDDRVKPLEIAGVGNNLATRAIFTILTAFGLGIVGAIMAVIIK